MKCSVFIFAVACALPAGAAVEFSRDIQPILSENCFHCHGPDAEHRKGDLRLDEEKAAKAGNIIKPGKPEESELIKRLFSHDPDEVMPTPKSNRKLTDTQKQAIQAELTSLGDAFDHILSQQAENGRLSKDVESANNRLTSQYNSLDEAIGGIVDVDLAEVAVRLNQAQFAYQSSASVFNVLRGLSLLDVLK